jgi:hypothetical protein
MVATRNYFPWFTLLLLALLWAPFQALAATEVGKILATRGEVSAAAADGQTRALKRGAALFEGDTVITGTDSFARIRFSDGGSVHLRAATRFTIAEYSFEQQGKRDVGRFDLVAGGFRAVTGAIGRDDKPAYSVKTPVTTIGIRGTDHEARWCRGDCGDLREQGIQPPEDGLYNATFEGETVVNGQGFKPGQYGYTNPAGVTIRLPRPPRILATDPMPDPADDTEYEGVSTEEGGAPAADEEQTADGGDSGDGSDDGTTPPSGTPPDDGASGSAGTGTDGTGTSETGTTTVTTGTEGQGEQFVTNPEAGFFSIPARDQQVVVLECPI